MKVHLIVDVDVFPYREVPPSAQEIADEMAENWVGIDTRLGWVATAVKVSDHRG